MEDIIETSCESCGVDDRLSKIRLIKDKATGMLLCDPCLRETKTPKNTRYRDMEED